MSIPSDVTINEDRYIRMPLKMLYIFVAGLCMATWAYFDLHAQTRDAVQSSKDNAIAISSVASDVSKIQRLQDVQTQHLDDFIDSSQKMYNRYFREPTDPEWRRPEGGTK